MNTPPSSWNGLAKVFMTTGTVADLVEEPLLVGTQVGERDVQVPRREDGVDDWLRRLRVAFLLEHRVGPVRGRRLRRGLTGDSGWPAGHDEQEQEGRNDAQDSARGSRRHGASVSRVRSCDRPEGSGARVQKMVTRRYNRLRRTAPNFSCTSAMRFDIFVGGTAQPYRFVHAAIRTGADWPRRQTPLRRRGQLAVAR